MSSVPTDVPTDPLEALISLGPDAQRPMDGSLIEANLELTPEQRIEAQSRMTGAILALQHAVRAAHG